MELREYEGWVYEDDYKGRYVDEKGRGLTGFWIKDFKYREEMKILNNGWTLVRYRYPREANISFFSPMVNWFNLLFCGGFYVLDQDKQRIDTPKRLFQRVMDGMKPIGFHSVKEDELEDMLKWIELSGLPYKVTYPEFLKKHFNSVLIGISQKGLVKDHFNLESLIESYSLLGAKSKPSFNPIALGDEMRIRQLGEMELSYFLEGWDYAHPKTNFELIKTGLLLGYPIESTFAIISGSIY